MTDSDQRLRELLAPPERPTDHAFVKAVNRAVQIEQRLQRARLFAWRNFLKEVAVTGAMLVPVALAAGSLGPAEFRASGLFLLIMFGLWTIMLRPDGASV